MTRHIHFVALGIAFMAGMQHISAQKRNIFHRIDSVLTARYQRAEIDTNYVVRPNNKWTVLGRFNMSGAQIGAQRIYEEHIFKSGMSAEYKSTLSIGVCYLGLSFNLSLNPAKLLGKYHDYELNFQSYGKRMGFEIGYQDSQNFKGWYELNGDHLDFSTSDDLFRLRTLYLSAYYVFNHRRFSYPAAFSHSYIQKRSAGSFLLVASGQGQYGEMENLNGLSVRIINFGIGAGYGYNFSPGRDWLLHISALPSFIVYRYTSLSMNDTDIPLRYSFPEVIITGRGAVVKQINRKMFAGLSMVYHYTNIGHEESINIHNQKWLIRLNFGYRF